MSEETVAIQKKLDALETMPFGLAFDRCVTELIGDIHTREDAARFKAIALKRISDADSITVTRPLSEDPTHREIETNYPEFLTKISGVIRVFRVIPQNFPELVDDELVKAMANIFKKIHHTMAGGSFDQIHDLSTDAGYIYAQHPSLALKYDIAGEWQKRVEMSADPREKQLLAQHFLTIFTGVKSSGISHAVKTAVELRPEFLKYIRDYCASPLQACAYAAQISGEPDKVTGEIWPDETRERERSKVMNLANRFKIGLLGGAFIKRDSHGQEAQAGM